MSGVVSSARGEQPRAPYTVVAMSGGVDSSVAAALLKQEGREVVGVTLQLMGCSEARGSLSSCGVSGIDRARAVAGELGIAHYVLDCVREFDHQVLRPAWDAYSCGRTPSPCLLCNERIKFGLLLAWARRIGASQIATGHYARVELTPDGEPILLRGRDPSKDQSYFLGGLDKAQLSRITFPIGQLDKAAVRSLCRSLGLSVAEARESQDACMVGPKESFAEMLRERFSGSCRTGVIADESGQVLGRHEGIHRFTVGQRRGLGVASAGRRWVKEVRAEDAVVVVTGREEGLLSQGLVAKGMNWLVKPPAGGALECEVQVRSRHHAAAATVRQQEDGTAAVQFHEPVQAVTPGQAAVFYDGMRVLGRGWIDAC